jgi:hypothetical protein
MIVLDFIQIVHYIRVTIGHYVIFLVYLLQLNVGGYFLEYRTAERVHALMF